MGTPGTPATANTLSGWRERFDSSHIGGMIRAVDKRLKLGLDHVFSGTRLEGGRDGNRSPFTVDHIRNVILAPGALDGLNDEAKDVVYIVMETGCRPSEIVNLSKSRIKLEAEIPFIRVEAEGRLLKTEHSERRHSARRHGAGGDEAAPGRLPALLRQRRQSIRRR